MNRRLYKLIPLGMIVIAGMLGGCGKQEETEEIHNKTVICSDFVSYDITRHIAEGSDIQLEKIDFSLVDWEKGLSGRDRNKINKSMLFINGTWHDAQETGIDSSVNSIKLGSFGDRKKNEKDNNKLYSGINLLAGEEKEDESSGNKQVVVVNPGATGNNQNNDNNKDKDKTEAETADKDKDTNNDKDDSEADVKDNPDSSKTPSDADADNSESNESSESDGDNSSSESNDNSQKAGIRLYFVDNPCGSPPVPADKNGKALGSFEPGYIVSKTNTTNDEYHAWLIDRVVALKASSRFSIIDNGNGTYTIFEDITALTPKLKVIASIDEIPISDVWQYRDVICEASTKSMLGAYADCFMEESYSAMINRQEEKIYLAQTVDFAEGFWLDVKNARKFAEEVKNRLVEADPDNKDIYESNFAQYDIELASLNDRLQFAVDSSKNRMIFIGGSFVYGYMTDGYNIDYVSIYDYANQEETASPTRLMNFADIIDEFNIKYVVKDKKSSMDGIDSVKKEIDHNLNTLILDTLEQVDDWESSSYIDLMDDNCTILKKALY